MISLIIQPIGLAVKEAITTLIKMKILLYKIKIYNNFPFKMLNNNKTML